MIKLSVEIKDDKFIYEYTVGEGQQAGTTHLCADSLALFTDILRLCSMAQSYRDKAWEREAIAKAYLEKNPTPNSGEKSEKD